MTLPIENSTEHTVKAGLPLCCANIDHSAPPFYSEQTTTKLRKRAALTMSQPKDMSLIVKTSPLNPQFGFTTTRNDTFALLIGPKKALVFVPKEHLIRSSTLIRHAMKTHKIGTYAGAIRLPRENLEYFSQYLRFIYSGKLPTEDHTSSEPTIWQKSSAESYTLLAKLYVVGERMIDRRLQDAVMKELVRLSRLPLHDGSYRFPGNNVAMAIHQGTTIHDPARRLLVDMYASFASEQWLNNPWVHPTFTLDLARALLCKVNTKTETNRFRHLDLNVENTCSPTKPMRKLACSRRGSAISMQSDLQPPPTSNSIPWKGLSSLTDKFFVLIFETMLGYSCIGLSKLRITKCKARRRTLITVLMSQQPNGVRASISQVIR